MDDNKSRYVAFIPNGDSMWPFLKNKKQTVLIDKTPTRVLPYDILLYQRQNGENILHRVIKVESEFYVCSGDSQFVLENVKKESVLGVLAGFYKGKKYIAFDDVQRKKAERYYNKPHLRKLRVKFFFLTKRVTGKIKRIFGK